MINEEALQGLRSSLDSDGYRLEVNEKGERVSVAIVATPEACPDCLVPKPLMLTILVDSLGVPEESIDLTYPDESEVSS